MRKILFCFFLSCNFFNLKSYAEYKVIPGSNILVYEYKLENGMKLFVVPDNRNALGTVSFSLNAGSDREKLGATGLAHFFEHMMFRKTKNNEEGNYDKVLSSVGGTGNAGTSDSFVTYYSSFPGPALDKIIELESQRFLNLDLVDPYFTTEKGAVISERRMRVENDPIARGNEIIRRVTEYGTSRQWMTIGEKQDVENISIETATQFYKDFYTPDNTTLIVGGPYQPENVFKLVEKSFKSWNSKAKKIILDLPKNYLTRYLGKSFICSESVNTKSIKFIYPSLDKSLDTLVYYGLFENSLDDHPEGPFNYRLLKDQKATAFQMYKTFWQNQSNPIVVSFELTADQSVDDIKNIWDNTIAQMLSKPLSRKIIERTIKQNKVSWAQSSERLTSVVETLSQFISFFSDPKVLFKEAEILKNIKESNYSNWIKSTFGSNKYYITGIVPLDQAPLCSQMENEFMKTINAGSN